MNATAEAARSHSPFREGLGPSSNTLAGPMTARPLDAWQITSERPSIIQTPHDPLSDSPLPVLQGRHLAFACWPSGQDPPPPFSFSVGLVHAIMLHRLVSRAPAENGLVRQSTAQGGFSESSAHSGAVILFRAAIKLQACWKLLIMGER